MSYHNNSPSSSSGSSSRGSSPASNSARGFNSASYVPNLGAPAGFHYMPDGTLMSDAEMDSIANNQKVINDFDLDLSPLQAASSIRHFSVSGDDGAIFNLEIKNEDNHYYNFSKRIFQASKSGLYNQAIYNGFTKGEVYFPTVTDDDKYDIFLSTDPLSTRHAHFNKVLFGDNSLDINSSTGSNSFLMTKVIYQYVDQTLTISPLSLDGTIEVGSIVSDTVTLSRGLTAAKQAFSIACSVTTAAKCYRIIKQPVSNDVAAFVSPVVGAQPTTIKGENIYPAITTAANSASEGGTTVNGASTGTTVTTHVVSSTIATLGDRVLGNDALAASIVTVTAISGGTGKTFTISEAISIADDLPLTFSNQMNYQWPINNFANILKEGMVVFPETNIIADSIVAMYQDTVIRLPGTINQEVIVKNEVEAITSLGKKPVIRNGDVLTQEGAVVFDKQQAVALTGDTVRIGGYGQNEILRIYDYDVVFSDLAITLTPITTTTTAAVVNSTSVPVASRNGILDAVSTVSGIGINPTIANPTVASGAGAVTGAGAIVLDAVQSLESGATLTFAGAGQTATITGDIQVLKAGTANQTLRFDINKLLSIT